MKSVVSIFVVLSIALVGCNGQQQDAVAITPDEPDMELVEYLFVQHSDTATLQDGKLILGGIGDDVLYFSDRPHRIAGRESLTEFLEAWDDGEDSFAVTPPNGVLTAKKGTELVDLAVILKDPFLNSENALVYTVEVLEGPQSGSVGFSALFIDAFGKKMRRGGKGRLGRDVGRGKPGAEPNRLGRDIGIPGAELGVGTVRNIGRRARGGYRAVKREVLDDIL